MGTLWPKKLKKAAVFACNCVISPHRIKCNTCIESFYQGLHFFFLHWRAMSNIWGHYDLEAWKFDDLTVLCAVLSALRNLSLKPWANQDMLTLKVIEGRWRSNRNLLTVACNCSRLVIIIIILFFRTARSESRISKTASHSATKLNSYIVPYPTMCSARFGLDPDYRSGSRAKSGFSDFPHYLWNLQSDLQLQYL